MLLLTITVANPERFTPKNKPVIYTRILVELYNWKNCGQVHEIYGIIELEKMHTLIAKSSYNLDIYWIIEIFLVLCSTHIAPRDQDKVMFYINNYID